jgi:hypothetical protein
MSDRRLLQPWEFETGIWEFRRGNVCATSASEAVFKGAACRRLSIERSLPKISGIHETQGRESCTQLSAFRKAPPCRHHSNRWHARCQAEDPEGAGFVSRASLAIGGGHVTITPNGGYG